MLIVFWKKPIFVITNNLTNLTRSYLNEKLREMAENVVHKSIMGKKIVFKASEDITKDTIKVGDSFMAYVASVYHESIFKVFVTRVEGATVDLQCKWFAISEGYDLGLPQHFRLEKSDKVWSFSGKLYKGKVTRKGEYSNTVYKLIRHPEFCEKYFDRIYLV